MCFNFVHSTQQYETTQFLEFNRKSFVSSSIFLIHIKFNNIKKSSNEKRLLYFNIHLV